MKTTPEKKPNKLPAPRKRKSNRGRKQFDGKDVNDVLQKLEQTAAMDASVEEMAFYAGISTTAYYEYVKVHPKFLDRINALRNKPVLAARQRVIQGIEESYDNAMKYLERKKKAEFSPKVEVFQESNISLELEDGTQRTLDGIFGLIEKRAETITPVVTAKDR